MHACVHECVCSVYACACMRTCVCMRVRVCVHVCVRVRACVCNVYVRVCSMLFHFKMVYTYLPNEYVYHFIKGV